MNNADDSEISQRKDVLAKNIVRQINRIIINNTTEKVPHILSSQVSLFIFDLKKITPGVISFSV